MLDVIVVRRPDAIAPAPTLLPDMPGTVPHLAVTSGKEGTIYLLNRDNLGKSGANTDLVYQAVPNAIPYSFDTPAYWNGHLFYFGSNDVLKDFALVSGKLSTAPVHQGTFHFKDRGGIPAHGNQRSEWDAGCRFDFPNPEHR